MKCWDAFIIGYFLSCACAVTLSIYIPVNKNGIRERSNSQVRVLIIIHVQVTSQRISKQFHFLWLWWNYLNKKKYKDIRYYVFLYCKYSYIIELNRWCWESSANSPVQALCWHHLESHSKGIQVQSPHTVLPLQYLSTQANTNTNHGDNTETTKLGVYPKMHLKSTYNSRSSFF